MIPASLWYWILKVLKKWQEAEADLMNIFQSLTVHSPADLQVALSEDD